jgi:GT2 family glycosyltransferase/glycosyltransferase involved in cell wall biosynthesis
MNSSTAPIDVIVPVYNAWQDVVTCVASVRRHTRAESYRLILIDDQSPDERIGEYFSALQAEHDVSLTLLRNSENLGFVGTVNRGMSLHSGSDVVLLNSDTIVTAGWLEKLRRCADSDLHIGTITPFSNNAEICSFPVFCQNNDLASLPDIEQINWAMEQAALPTYPEIPTAVGFCMFIRRSLIEKIGTFDAETFGLGYGEENDFCMRALKAGYRNVLCDDTFVAHTGGRSFDNKKRALMEANLRRLIDKHPEYPQHVHTFIAADPLRPLRQMAETSLRILANDKMSGILHILHSRQGGTENHIRDLMRAEDRHFRHYLLIVQGNKWLLEDGNGDEWLNYEIERQDDEPWSALLNSLCHTLKIALCHVHHLSGARDGLLIALAALETPYGLTLHDSYLACPTVTLLDSKGMYCGAINDPEQCQRCLDAQSMFRGIKIAEWRAQHRQLVQGAAFLLAPSMSVAETFGRYFSEIPIRIIPHGIDVDALRHNDSDDMCSALLLPHDLHEVIGVLGAIGPVKGARRLEKLVARTKARQLPLRWVVIGYTDHQYQPWQDKDKTLTIHGSYNARQLHALLDHYRIRMTVFPSAGPESFSYTLSESWTLGRPALAPPIGALGERVSHSGAGWIMDDWQNEDRILDQIMTICAPANDNDFMRRTTIANEIKSSSLPEMAEATARVYSECLTASSATQSNPAQKIIVSKKRLLAAAKHSLQTTISPKNRNVLFSRSLLHFALRLRYTGLGIWLYRIVPLHWQKKLKTFLLA